MTRAFLAGIALGFLAGQQYIIYGYDPEDLARAGRQLAAQAYLLGCVNAGKPGDACQQEAEDWYQLIERR
jgi:hypothetical protein